MKKRLQINGRKVFDSYLRIKFSEHNAFLAGEPSQLTTFLNSKKSENTSMDFSVFTNNILLTLRKKSEITYSQSACVYTFSEDAFIAIVNPKTNIEIFRSSSNQNEWLKIQDYFKNGRLNYEMARFRKMY